MNGEFSFAGEYILLILSFLYSFAVFAIGRRVTFPASAVAYGTAIATLVANLLLSHRNILFFDQVVGIVGVGLLVVHMAFMAFIGGLLVTFVLATHQWAWRHYLAIGGSIVLTVLFALLWLEVKRLHLPDPTLVFYGIRAGRPPAVLWMNVSMGLGLAYIAVWSLVEFTHFFRSARTTYEQSLTGIGIVLYALAAIVGLLTMTEAIGHQQGVDMAKVRAVKLPFSLLVTAATVVVIGFQIWLRPLWRNRRQLLVRYLEPELAQLRNDLLNLSAAEAELHLDIHHEAYANRTMVDAVAACCQAAGVSPARRAIARMATSLITFQRDNVIQDPSYGLVTSWEQLREEAAAEIDQSMATTAWEKALRDTYVSQHVYIVMFLVLESRAYRDILLVDERPHVHAWHEHLADLIATVLHEHGHTTPRFAAIRQRQAATPSWRAFRTRRPVHNPPTSSFSLLDSLLESREPDRRE